MPLNLSNLFRRAPLKKAAPAVSPSKQSGVAAVQISKAPATSGLTPRTNINPYGASGPTRASAYSNLTNALETRIRPTRPNFMQAQYQPPTQQQGSARGRYSPTISAGTLLGQPVIRVANPAKGATISPDKKWEQARPTRGAATVTPRTVRRTSATFS